MSLISPLGWIYGKIAAVRNSLYDTNTIQSYPLGAPTISIGNITTGGTGKTPLVRYVAEILANRRETVCILTRGYGRRDESERVLVSDGENVLIDVKAAGDEPVELARRLLGKAIIVADADRVSAAAWAREKFGVTAFVLDDAFQHRRARRDVDIVCIDATDPFGNEMLIPAGRLREPLTGLSRADVIVTTRCELAEDIEQLERRIGDFATKASVFRSYTRLREFKRIGGVGNVDWDFAESAYAFAGVGNPAAFFSLLRNENVNVAGSLAFRDHYDYSQHDIDRLETDARSAGAAALITTAKDAVKLERLHFRLPCLAANIDIEIDRGEEFEKLIISAFSSVPPSYRPSSTP
jgi:tetraacyldisaccharide 4'-kinase